MLSAALSRVALFFSFARAAHAEDESCWYGQVNAEMCCNPKPGGNPHCFDMEYTYERCCLEEEKKLLDVVPGVPLLGGGSMPMAGLGLCCRPSAKGDAVRRAVVDYLRLGGRLLDDATLYENHKEVGAGIREAMMSGTRREDIFFVTKIQPLHFGFEMASDWVPRMLEEVGLQYVDLVLLHWASHQNPLRCGEPKHCRQETWLALQRAQRLGLIKHLGVSNFGPRQMTDILALGGAPIEVNQIEFHPWAPTTHFDTVEWCHERGIAVTAYGSMGAGDTAKLNMQDLTQIARQHDKTIGQVLLRWALEHNVSVIPGTSKPDHMAENLQIFNFHLDEATMNMFDNVPEDQRMLYYGHWPDQLP